MKKINTILPEFDQLNIVDNSTFNLIYAETGHGKTTLLIQLAHKLSDNGYKVLFVSLETRVEAINEKLQQLGTTDQVVVKFINDNVLDEIHNYIANNEVDVILIDNIMLIPDIDSAIETLCNVCEETNLTMFATTSLPRVVPSNLTKKYQSNVNEFKLIKTADSFNISLIL